MSPPDAPRDRPTPARHLAGRPPAPEASGAGAFGPPLDPPVYLSEEGLLPDEPGERGERATAGTRLSPTRASSAAPAPTTPAAPGETEGDHGDPGDRDGRDGGPGGGGRGGSGGNGHGPGDGDLDPVDDREADDREAEAEVERRYGRIANLVDLGIVLACCLFVFLQLGPGNLFADTTPAGGDMGAHVWGPAYLRDHLLPNLQVAGWAPDWYAGFPAYQFYMVLPALLIVLLDLGLEGPLALLPLAVAVACGWFAHRSWHLSSTRRRNLFLTGAVLALCCIGMPYGVAFKLVSISGAVTLPAAAYAFGRLAGLKFPTPALLSAASLVFLFYRGFTIYGGNLPSTLAGEFAFSMSLSLGLLYLGVLFRGFETGRHRGLAAVLLALTGLCHLIPAFWVLGATVVAVVVRPRRTSETTTRPAALLAGAGALICLLAAHWNFTLFGWRFDDSVVWDASWKVPLPGLVGGGRELPVPVWVGGAMLVAALVLWLLPSLTARFVVPPLVVGGLLSAWWVLPFQRRGLYVNDMGWEKIPIPNQTPPQTWMRYLLPPDVPDTPGSDLRWVFAIALVGVGLALAARLRQGVFLTACAVVLALAFWWLPDGRLWNARLLPFYYLTVMFLAALAVGEGLRLIVQLVQAAPRPAGSTVEGTGESAAAARSGDGDPRRTFVPNLVTAVAGTLVVLVIVGLPLGVLPFKEKVVAADGAQGYAWPSFSPWQAEASPTSYVKGWANWNYEGYEGKPAYGEYYEIVRTMETLGEQSGCGRAMWEYEPGLDRYGTPMALMLLPYWTDGCIGSMEGLYFEASSTTPFHFLMQDELSDECSCAQRDMPYGDFNINRGVQHMQLLGVRYYLATSDLAVQAASAHPDLTRVEESGPWVVFEVANSPLVQPLVNEPLVVDGNDGSQEEWLEEPLEASGRNDGPATRWYMHPELWDVAVAQDGPEEWGRIDADEIIPGQPLQSTSVTPARVTDVEVDRDSISFDVDRVGSPVLVKASYFPNWSVSGGEGPYRVAPNLMVVVPTDEHVEITYGRTSLEWMAYLVTLLGIVGLVVLVRRGTYRFGG